MERAPALSSHPPATVDAVHAAIAAAAPYLFTLTQWLEADGVDPAQFPKVAEHRQRMAARPAVKRALDAELAV